MPELLANVELASFMRDNDIRSCQFVGFIGHAENKSVYGALFNTPAGLLFQQHKWAEVNAGKSLPRVCAAMKYKHKMVSEDIRKSFSALTASEYYDRDAMDMISV